MTPPASATARAKQICHECPNMEKLQRTMDEINAKLGDGKVTFATYGQRLCVLERIVFSSVGLVLLVVGGAILKVIIR